MNATSAQARHSHSHRSFSGRRLYAHRDTTKSRTAHPPPRFQPAATKRASLRQHQRASSTGRAKTVQHPHPASVYYPIRSTSPPTKPPRQQPYLSPSKVHTLHTPGVGRPHKVKKPPVQPSATPCIIKQLGGTLHHSGAHKNHTGPQRFYRPDNNEPNTTEPLKVPRSYNNCRKNPGGALQKKAAWPNRLTTYLVLPPHPRNLTPGPAPPTHPTKLPPHPPPPTSGRHYRAATKQQYLTRS